MKKKLLLFLSDASHPELIPTASTLAWLCRTKNCLFDNYYHSYHRGIHFPGGDSRDLEIGFLTGGTVAGDRHFEEFYFLLHNFEVTVICFKETIFGSSIKNLDVPLLCRSNRVDDIYKKAFHFFDVPLPSDVVMIGSNFERGLSGLHAYLYPEIYYRRALGVLDKITDDELAELTDKSSRIFCFFVDDGLVSRLKSEGYEVEVVDELKENDDYLSISKRIALRYQSRAEGWILGDPILVSHWLPKACEENLIAIYSIPQKKILFELGDIISSRGKVVYGRQHSDEDFFELSKLNQCFQVIDPCRPPFQSQVHADYRWETEQNKEGFYSDEYSEEELVQFAQDGKVLISLMFWSGMIREIANLYNLMELFAISKLRCGLVLTAQSFEYMMHSPLELLVIPYEQGGVYPLVEAVLGSGGIGVGIESYIEKDRLSENLREALSRILQKVGQTNLLPRGWWPTLDTELQKLSPWKRPKPLRFLKYSPYFQFRFKKEKKMADEHSGRGRSDPGKGRVKDWIKKKGLTRHLEPYRPYEFYRSGPLQEELIRGVKAAGLEYMFTKAGFQRKPKTHYLDDDFIALNYTAGQWDGWTPFETVNDVSDLRKAEKTLLRSGKPGWIVSTVDSCLWAFSGEFWKRGNRLYEIAKFCSEGGGSKKLINVKPYTIARYARIISRIGIL